MNQPVRMLQFRVGEDLSEPSPKFRVPLVEAGAFACKYIIGPADENAVCCGAPTDGRSWCPYHRNVVFDFSKSSRLR